MNDMKRFTKTFFSPSHAAASPLSRWFCLAELIPGIISCQPMRRYKHGLTLLIMLLALQVHQAQAQSRKSDLNYIIIFTDDQGYGDLGCYGHPTIKTPNIDKMAAEGQRWTTFYTAANVCTPSRAGLLTGRLPIRNGMCSNNRRVLFPDSDGGLPQTENTIAKLLKGAGYKTAAIGKWHLGHLPQYLPTSHGFDSYFGIPYSNDMDRVSTLPAREAIMNAKKEYFDVPLMRNEEIVERPADQNTIVRRYTEEALKFISENRKKPFFLYLAHSLPHVPLFASENFRGKSERGLYGDVIEEIDWSVGQILQALKKQKLDKKTLVIFTSDNGPWALYNEHGGSAGPLFGAKGTGYEGGQRVPAIFWAPGKIKPGVITEMGSTLDLLPTIATMSRLSLPADRKYDGYDLGPVLQHGSASPRNEMFFYHGTRIFAARKGDFKMYFYENNPGGYPERMHKLDTATLFNLQHDPSEKYNLADKHPEVLQDISELVQQHRATVDSVASQLEKTL
jgi:arylsulfatase A-like enzyme